MLWLARFQLKSKKTAFRRKALERLCQQPHSQAFSLLQGASGDEDPEIRRLAISALGKLEDERRLDPLLAALRDESPEVQRTAILALKKIPGEKVISAVRPLLRHPDAAVRGSAAQVLEGHGWRPTNVEEEVWFWIAGAHFSRAAGFGLPALPALELVVERGPYTLAVAAVQAIGAIRDPQSLRPLFKALKSSDAAVCVAALDVLGRFAFPEATEPVTAMLSHREPHVRLAAIEAVGDLGFAGAAERIIGLLEDPAWDVRRAAVEALGRMKSPVVVDALIPALQDSDSDVKEAAALALASVGDRRGIGPLVLALADPSSGMRRMAAGALSRLDPTWALSSEAREAAEQLRMRLTERDSDLKHFVEQLFGSLGELTSVTAPRGAPPSGVTDAQATRRKLAVSLFLVVLSDADPDLRQAAAEALGKLGGERVKTALLRAAADPDPGVRNAASQSLENLTSENSSVSSAA